jgi:hypothetical protein
LLIIIRSSLAVACRRGLLDIGRLLLARGACVENVDLGGGTALANLWLHPNLPFSRFEFAQALFAISCPPLNPEASEFFNPLYCAAMRGVGEDIDFLVAMGADINNQDCFGNYVIQYCIWGSNISTYKRVEEFMSMDWVNRKNRRGRTPLHMALEFPGTDTVQICEALLKAGADIHALDNENNAPHDIAIATDKRSKGIHMWKIGICRNFEAYLQALTNCGYDIEVRDGEIFWVSNACIKLNE